MPKDKAADVPKRKRTPFTVFGNLEHEHIRSAYVERHNLTMQMSVKRYTSHERLLDAHAEYGHWLGNATVAHDRYRKAPQGECANGPGCRNRQRDRRP